MLSRQDALRLKHGAQAPLGFAVNPMNESEDLGRTFLRHALSGDDLEAWRMSKKCCCSVSWASSLWCLEIYRGTSCRSLSSSQMEMYSRPSKDLNVSHRKTAGVARGSCATRTSTHLLGSPRATTTPPPANSISHLPLAKNERKSGGMYEHAGPSPVIWGVHCARAAREGGKQPHAHILVYP